MEKTGMYYTHCFEEHKLCKDKDKLEFEEIIDGFNDENTKKEL